MRKHTVNRTETWMSRTIIDNYYLWYLLNKLYIIVRTNFEKVNFDFSTFISNFVRIYLQLLQLSLIIDF